MRRAAILDDAQAARRDLILDPVVEQDDAVGNIFLDAVARQLPVAALAGDNGGDALVLEPTEQRPQLGAKHQRIVEAAEQRLDRVEDDALRADAVDRVAQADKQAFKVVVAAFLDLGALDPDIVDDELAVGDQRIDVDAERGNVDREIGGALLEAHQHAGFAGQSAVDEEGHREQRLAATRRAASAARSEVRRR